MRVRLRWFGGLSRVFSLFDASLVEECQSETLPDRVPPDSPISAEAALPQRCPTRLIPDDPSDDDALGVEGYRPHQEVARVLARMLVEEPTAGRAIGLEGPWGSGKSTVLRLLQKELRQANLAADLDIRVVTFDSWAHEGDPLRRSFIESTLDQLAAAFDDGRERWLHPDTKTQLRSDLTAKKTRTHVSPWGELLTISAALAALGLALLPRDWTSTIAFWPLGIPDPRFTVPLLLAASPLLVRIFRTPILTLFWKATVENDNSLLTKASNTTVSTADPTTIEFMELFDRAMKEALPPDKKRRLVVVLDNLDRLSPENAQKAWATVQAFLQGQLEEKEHWFSQVWLLVPYDASRVLRHSAEDKSAAEGHLVKMFSARFRVPPITVPDWRLLLKRYLGQALPTHQDESENWT